MTEHAHRINKFLENLKISADLLLFTVARSVNCPAARVWSRPFVSIGRTMKCAYTASGCGSPRKITSAHTWLGPPRRGILWGASLRGRRRMTQSPATNGHSPRIGKLGRTSKQRLSDVHTTRFIADFTHTLTLRHLVAHACVVIHLSNVTPLA